MAQCWPCPDPDGTSVVVTTERSRVGSCCCVSLTDGDAGAGGTVGAGVVTEGVVTVGATVVTVCAGAGFCVGDATVDGMTVAVAVGGLVTTGSLDGTVAVEVAVAEAVDDTVDGAEVTADVEDDGDEVTVELLDAVDDAELVVSVGDVDSDGCDVEDVGEVDDDADVLVSDVEVVDVLDDELDDDVVSTTGTGSSVSGEDGRTGIGSPAGGSVAAGSCSTTL